MLRVVVDTNVLISALLKANGNPAKVVSLWRTGEFELVISPETIDELSRVLGYERIRTRVTPEEAERFLSLLQTAATIITPQIEVTAVKDDPDDDKFLSLALASDAEYIVSGDKHLLSIKVFRGVPILTPVQFLETIPPSTTE